MILYNTYTPKDFMIVAMIVIIILIIEKYNK